MPHRIVICHLESLVCLPALNSLFAEFGSEIGLVLASNRFGSSHGGALRQFQSGVRRMGWRQTLYLGFDIVAAQASSHVSRWLRRLSPHDGLATLPELAARHGARYVETGDVNSVAIRELVRDYSPDLVIVMNFDQILKAEFIALPRLAVVNIHPSLRPSLRGPCPAFWALSQERARTGASVHLIETSEIDAGRLLAQSEIAVDRKLSVAELTTRLFESGVLLLPAVVATLAADRDAGRLQDLQAGEYYSFPRATDVAVARRRGVRLARAAHVLRLIAATWGVVRWSSAVPMAAAATDK